MKIEKNLILFLNQKIGFQVLNFLIDKDKVFFAIVVKERNEYYLDTIKLLKKNKIKHTSNLKYFEKIKIKKSHNIDFIISVYWPLFIPMDLIRNVKNSINFHPSFLPLNRGWYPHVYNIINGSQAGVSLHQLSSKFDEGDIWAKKKVKVNLEDNASSLHERLAENILKLFKLKWDLIKQNKIKPKKQKITHKFNSKKDVTKFDRIYLNKEYKASELFKLLAARNFYNKTYAYFVSKGKKYEIFFNLKKL